MIDRAAQAEEEEVRKVYRTTTIVLAVFVAVLLLGGIAYTLGSDTHKPEWENPETMLLIEYGPGGVRTVCVWAEQGSKGGLSCPAWLQTDDTLREACAWNKRAETLCPPKMEN